jgi:hypothetical protein
LNLRWVQIGHTNPIIGLAANVPNGPPLVFGPSAYPSPIENFHVRLNAVIVLVSTQGNILKTEFDANLVKIMAMYVIHAYLSQTIT